MRQPTTKKIGAIVLQAYNPPIRRISVFLRKRKKNQWRSLSCDQTWKYGILALVFS
jgi:hypothetical protein